MLIGVDFDNTIVSYDALFHKVALERELIPADLPVNKSEVRNYLRRIGKEDVWTEMQGYVYGGRMAEALPYPGVIDFFKACRAAGIELRIISHKTRYPFLGHQYDLHQAAANWLELQGFFDSTRIGLPRENVFFELTKQEKLQRVGLCGCTHFIDDLPELLGEPSFPEGVERILFDPANIYPNEKFTRFQSWPDIRSYLTRKPSDERSDALRSKVGPLLAKRGIAADFNLELVRGGGNNRVYRVCSGERAFALKEYFQNASDPRDRFGAEMAFYNFLWQHGVHEIPEPLAWDTEQRLGLFDFVQGRKLEKQEINPTLVNRAAQFIVNINRHRQTTEASRVPVASEACFSVAEHIACVERRVTRLEQIGCASEIDQQARAFVHEELVPAWQALKSKIASDSSGSLNDTIQSQEKCLSPSDFGFHNGLLSQDGALRFFDFEYAGWDDPAKLICDFFCQPQIPVDLSFWNTFVDEITGDSAWGRKVADRAVLLFPAYQVKWCCIMLNEFVRGDQARRDFAHGAGTATERKVAQLQKTRVALQQVKGIQ